MCISAPTNRTTGRALACGLLALSTFGLLPAAATVADPAPTRQSELIYLLKQDCGSCHGLTLKGGLAPPLLPDTIAERDDETLVEAILDGRPGTPMPPWRFEIAPQEAVWLVKQLRRGIDTQ